MLLYYIFLIKEKPLARNRFSIFIIFIGIGWSMVMISGIVCIYHNIIITWILYFLAMSFTSQLPWATCDNSWNTYRCSTYDSKNTNRTNGTYLLAGNKTLLPEHGNVSHFLSEKALNPKPVTAAEEFWQ